MRLAIISDIHDDLINLGRCLAWCKDNKINRIICCGDVTGKEALKFLSDNFSGSIYLVRGNVDTYREQIFNFLANIKYYFRSGRIKINGQWVGVCHEPRLVKQVLRQGPCSIIFYGHTHKPWIVRKKTGLFLVNPGALAGPLSTSSFAFWDTEKNKLELKILKFL